MGVVRHSWCVGTRCCLCSSHACTYAYAHLHIWVCTVSAPCPRPSMCDGTSAGLAWAHTSMRCHEGTSDWDRIPMCAPPVCPGTCGPEVINGWGVPMHGQCRIPPTMSGLHTPGLRSRTTPATRPQLRWSWCLAQPRLTLLEPVSTVRGSFNLMKCEAFYGLLITW